MKSQIKALLPIIVLDFWGMIKYRLRNRKRKNKPRAGIFNEIIKTNSWKSDETLSGNGSNIDHTRSIISGLNKLIEEYQISSILDLPCGDFYWMQHVNLSNINYVGGEIVEELILLNTQRFAAPNIQFQHMDIVNSESLPMVDLMIVRDCFVHLTFEEIKNAISNVKSSGSSYLLMTDFPLARLNYSVHTGDWRPINFKISPYSFPKPIQTIQEDYPEQFKINYRGKNMSLWRIADIPDLTD